MAMRSLVFYPPEAGEPPLSREEHEALADEHHLGLPQGNGKTRRRCGRVCLLRLLLPPRRRGRSGARAPRSVVGRRHPQAARGQWQEHREMLHDELLETYWRYLELRNARAKLPSD